MALEITEGFFGKVRLDGLRVAGAYRWPGPVHEGNGTWWSVIDRRASEEQTEALFTILGGQEQDAATDGYVLKRHASASQAGTGDRA